MLWFQRSNRTNWPEHVTRLPASLTKEAAGGEVTGFGLESRCGIIGVEPVIQSQNSRFAVAG